jgi:DNA-binding SARP family transcriptional activator
MALFSVRTLGFPEIRRDDRLCQLALRKGLALLIYLAETKGSVGRDVVATMLWPESSEGVVRTRLRRLLHRLQLTLGDDVLTTDRSTVRWSSAIDLQVDSQLFEQACDRGEFEPACRLYLGDFLEGFAPSDCPQFDEWAFFRREALRAGRSMRSSAWCATRMLPATTRPRRHTPAVSLSSIRSAKCTAGTSSAISCSPEIAPPPSATSRR